MNCTSEITVASGDGPSDGQEAGGCKKARAMADCTPSNAPKAALVSPIAHARAPCTYDAASRCWSKIAGRASLHTRTNRTRPASNALDTSLSPTRTTLSSIFASSLLAPASSILAGFEDKASSSESPQS